MNHNSHEFLKNIPFHVKRALLIILVFIICIILIDKVVERTSPIPSLSNADAKELPEFALTTSQGGALYASVADLFAQDSDALTHALATYEHDLLNYFGAAWVSPQEIDSSITQELFGVPPDHLEARAHASRFLWNQQTNKEAMGLLGWIIQPDSSLTSSLATHSSYLEKQGWIPLASNSETTLSLVKEQSRANGMSQETHYSWLLVELLTIGDSHLALYSFQ